LWHQPAGSLQAVHHADQQPRMTEIVQQHRQNRDRIQERPGREEAAGVQGDDDEIPPNDVGGKCDRGPGSGSRARGNAQPPMACMAEMPEAEATSA
jgi:hypothetical protein